ncbi:FtsW/RodA/SpoVE family cell cycle protein [Paenibacillus alba]|uniref:FtsW/RodA/SpoVE family cell cycle protein n=1 Tax=Paenibacillus alba TaxID=1197127 RepID=A0ABU6G4D0_9BACL|nr:FtsW/RodA/SpoVE family cell cycle protein [Paenibacillus alba]MEC0229024.1 FtsW/RodA/SpoVE family cell cycle protein [Paenibacillus alba]
MMQLKYEENIREFLKQVLSHIRAKEVHREVRMELESHLQDIIEEKLSRGIALNTAIQEAISQMGAPELIGAQFHKVHRPRTDWKLLAIMAVFMLFGLVAVFAAQVSLSERIPFNQIGMTQVIYTCVGVVLMLTIGFANYQKMAKYSWTLYVGTLLLLLYTINTGARVNGLHSYLQFGAIPINFVSLSPYFILLSLAGIWSTSSKVKSNESFIRSMARKVWINFGIVLLPSMIILKAHSIVDFVIFIVGCMVMLLVLKAKRSIFLAHISLLFATILFVLFKETYISYRLMRLTAFLNPSDDPLGTNYVLTQSKKAIESAGWWGHGFGSSLNTLPEFHSTMMFPFLIYCFGWLAGILILMLVILFIFHSLQISKKVHDPYGKALISSLLALFVIQFIWPMLMSLGWAPLSSFSIPFISYQGAHVVFQFAAIGVILSVYRRKDIIPSISKPK